MGSAFFSLHRRSTPYSYTVDSAASIILIVFFAVAVTLILVILGALERVSLDGRTELRRVETDEIRDQAKEETHRIRQREALASGRSPDEPVPTAVDLSLT